jgi:hypothetical protein
MLHHSESLNIPPVEKATLYSGTMLHRSNANQTTTHLSNANDAASSSVHERFRVLLTEPPVEACRYGRAVGEVILHKRLPTKLVHTLQDLVACAPAQAREERQVAASEPLGSSVFEDDLGQAEPVTKKRLL